MTILEMLEQPVDVVEPDDEPCTAESAECTCPEFCERDHEID